jgi:hypothetical protein
MVTLALLQGVLNTSVIFLARIIGSIVDRALFKNDRQESGIGFFLTTLAARVPCRGADLADTGNMIDALEALKRSLGEPLALQSQVLR